MYYIEKGGVYVIIDTFKIGDYMSRSYWCTCLLYTSDAADDLTRVDLGGRRIIKKKKNKKNKYYINICFFFVFFFFQAEDGIRDLVRSRGLGDVYKRQHSKSGII